MQHIVQRLKTLRKSVARLGPTYRSPLGADVATITDSVSSVVTMPESITMESATCKRPGDTVGKHSVFAVNDTNPSPKAEATTYEQKSYALGTHPVLTTNHESVEGPKENDIAMSAKTSFMYTLHQCANIELPFLKYLCDESQRNQVPWLVPAHEPLPDFTDVQKTRYFLHHPCSELKIFENLLLKGTLLVSLSGSTFLF